MAKKEYSLAHTKWMCKYHIVFTPKYRRKIIYNQYKADHRGASYAGSYPYAGKYSTENQCIIVYGIFEGKKCAYDIRQTRKFKI